MSLNIWAWCNLSERVWNIDLWWKISESQSTRHGQRGSRKGQWGDTTGCRELGHPLGLSVHVLTAGSGERLVLLHLLRHQLRQEACSLLEVHLVPETAGGGHRTVTGRAQQLTGCWGERGWGVASMDECVVLRAAVRHVV